MAALNTMTGSTVEGATGLVLFVPTAWVSAALSRLTNGTLVETVGLRPMTPGN